MLSLLATSEKPAALVAAREKSVIAGSVRLREAVNLAAAATADLANKRAGLVEVETELAAPAQPSVDDQVIESRLKRQAHLSAKLEGFQYSVMAAETELSAREGDVAAARTALLELLEELDNPLDNPPRDAAADLPRLEQEAAKLQDAADKAGAIAEQVERDGEAALAAFVTLTEIGATEDETRRVLASRRQTREKIAAAQREVGMHSYAARVAQARVAALQERLSHDRTAVAFDKALSALQADRPAVVAAGERYNQVGAQAASLVRTCGVFLDALDSTASRATGHHVEKYGKAFMRSPNFVENARLPVLGSDGFFVSGHWSHSYENFELRQDILAPLKKLIAEPNANFDAVFKVGAALFDEEYVKIVQAILAEVAPIYAWSAAREAAFVEAGEITRSVAQPAFPFQERNNDFQLWRRISLPSLRVGGAPIWSKESDPKLLLGNLKRAEAA